ncbi:MAG: ubiquinone/menaquinone biosynthesis methyltransferase [Smithellaceae bacterium]|nr:ubiquinone/menaquinone biosynthesis methyltransferase [Smithellaceae bacterium]
MKDNRPQGEFIRPREHVRLVRDIFSSIPKRYDLLNHLFSFGQDIRWRNFTVGKMAFNKTNRFLDVATGTADLAIAAARRYPAIEAAGLDFVNEMMSLGQVKIDRYGLTRRVRLIRGDATNLPFSDDAFDVTAIAFGIRNIPDKLQALREMTRVTVPGGQVFVLEMGFPRQRHWQLLFYPYLNLVLPLLSRLLSRNPAAYRYLADSIMNFPAPEEFMKLMENAALSEVSCFPLTMGITNLYRGIKSS